MGQPEFQTVPIDQVVESTTNPRRHRDARKQAELQKSIEKSGVLVPLLVRPLNGSLEIVAGSRRYHAALAAGLQALPARVRPFTDTEVLEIQVIENLQREDVHPLDEATGYQALLEKAKYDVERIADRVGKSTSYVYQRLKLVDLVPEAKAAAFKGDLTAGHAILLARLQPADQQAALMEAYNIPTDYRTGKPRRKIGTNDEMTLSVRALGHWIDNNVHLDLHGATFPKDDGTLLPSAGRCTVCPKRTGASPLLFADITKKDTCTDRACFHEKVKAFAERTVREVEDKGKPVVRISTAWGSSYQSDAELKKDGVLSQGVEPGYRDAGKKRCPHTVTGVVVHSDYDSATQVGQTKLVCTRPKSCKTHRERFDSRLGVTVNAAWRAKQKLREAKERQTREVRGRILEGVVSKVRTLGKVDLALVADRLFQRLYDPEPRRVLKDLGWLADTKKPTRGYGGADTDRIFRKGLAGLHELDELAGLVVRLALVTDAGRVYGETVQAPLRAAAKRYRVDVGKITRTVTAEFRQKAKAKAKKVARKLAPRRGTCRICGCTDDLACTLKGGPCTWMDLGHTLCSNPTCEKAAKGDRVQTSAKRRQAAAA